MPDDTGVLDDLDVAFTKVDGTKIYSLTQMEKDVVAEMYANYDASAGLPKAEFEGANLNSALKEALHDAYGEVQEGRRLQRLRDKIKLLAVRCPFCGIGPVTDLDHHLPRSRFKGLSIYARNLVPSCHSCNNKKRAVAGDTPNRQLVHAYFEKLPMERFLFANVSIAGAGCLNVDFEVRHVAAMSDDVYERVSFQIKRLNLVERYRPEVNVFLDSQKDSFELAFGPERDVVRLRAFLNTSAKTHELTFGLNDWRTALFYGVEACEDFCNGGFRQVFFLRKSLVHKPGA